MWYLTDSCLTQHAKLSKRLDLTPGDLCLCGTSCRAANFPRNANQGAGRPAIPSFSTAEANQLSGCMFERYSRPGGPNALHTPTQTTCPVKHPFASPRRETCRHGLVVQGWQATERHHARQRTWCLAAQKTESAVPSKGVSVYLAS